MRKYERKYVYLVIFLKYVRINFESNIVIRIQKILKTNKLILQIVKRKKLLNIMFIS